MPTPEEPKVSTEPENVDYEVVASAMQLRSGDLKSELVVVPEWKTASGKASAFYVSELTGAEMDECQESMIQYGKGADYRMSLKANTLRLLAYAVRDANNNRLWPDTDKGINALGFMGQTGLARLAKVANRLNGRGEESPGKDSAPTQNGSSSSNSVSHSESPADEPSFAA